MEAIQYECPVSHGMQYRDDHPGDKEKADAIIKLILSQLLQQHATLPPSVQHEQHSEPSARNSTACPEDLYSFALKKSWVHCKDKIYI
jgi:hypothetical protein